MIEAALLILCAVLLLRWWLAGDGWDTTKQAIDRAARPKFNYQSPRASSRYPAVSIRVAQDCCQAARQASGTRYLSEEAPILPLPGCSNERCRCTYAHHSERRSGTSRRRQILGLSDTVPSWPAGVEKRSLNGRRTGDLSSA